MKKMSARHQQTHTARLTLSINSKKREDGIKAEKQNRPDLVRAESQTG